MRGPSPQSAAAAGAPLSGRRPAGAAAGLLVARHAPLSPQKGAATSARDVPGSPTSPSRARPPATPPRQTTPPGGAARSRREGGAAAARPPEAGTPSPRSPGSPRRRGGRRGPRPRARRSRSRGTPVRRRGEGAGCRAVPRRGARGVRGSRLLAPLLMHRVHGTDPMEAAASGSGSMSARARARARHARAVPRVLGRDAAQIRARRGARVPMLRGDRVVDAGGGRRRASRRSTSSTRTSAPAGELLGEPPRLEFLKDSPEFQDRYLETVTYRSSSRRTRRGMGSSLSAEFLRRTWRAPARRG